MEIVKPLDENEIDSNLLEKIQSFKGPLGVIPSSVKTMSYHPKIADALTNLNIAVMECKGSVTPEFKRLIGYISSFSSGCLYCQAHTILGAERFGSSKKRLDEVWTYSNSSAFSDAEKAALDFAFAAASVPNKVTGKLVSQLKRYWNDNDIIEIMSVIALFGSLNRWNDSMGSALEDLPIEKGEKYLEETTNWTPGKHRV
ncbi:MAG: carboxymuconolactone decarboxylase family protein [Paracoccaceae bacterium]